MVQAADDPGSRADASAGRPPATPKDHPADAPAGTSSASRSAGAPEGSHGGRMAWVVLLGVWASWFVVDVLDAPEIAQRTVKGLLMPALLLWVYATLGSRTPRWLALGLVFATVGDIAIDVRLELGLAGFLVMQLCYIAGFLQLGAARAVSRRWLVIAAYAVLWLGVNLFLGPSFGELRIPVAVYTTAICTMAALAAGVSTRVGIGAALFVVSDTLIALGLADVDLSGRAALIMPTYLLGQYLIASGWVGRVAAPAP